MDPDDLVFHPWAVQGPRDVPTLVGGSGSYVVDESGRRYLDFSSQLVFTSLGHQHPRIVAAIKAQADRLCTLAPGHASDIRSEAARLIVEVAPERLGHVLFTTGGTEAIEHAVRMARLYTGRPKVLAAYRSYHGSTTTSIHLTGDPRRWASDTGAAGAVHFFGPFLYRSAFGSRTPEEECERALAHLEQVILLEGPSTIAGLVLESVVGSSGVLVPPPGYLRGVRELCDRHGMVYIADEVMVGFGRTGAWFGVDHDGVAPDLMAFAKGVNSGYVPLGGVLVSDAIYELFTKRPYPAGMTYSGHPLACAAAVGAINAMHEEHTIAAAARLGTDILGPALRELAGKHESVGDVRGIGGLWSLELVRNRLTKEPLVPAGATAAGNAPMVAVAKACRERGLLPLVLGNRLHVAPPLNVTDSDAAAGLTILDEALSVADTYL
ncbi:aspartate aminotransferase family protein [Arthrobacter sp. ISL-72]|uniref:aspartate aminotransferase family protein n=1 Tax=Arthrobacter sp. ISL-72 TaxID=2819114 RepID=UPI001BE5800F|nr:aspartate aminotransferase family protein [Arthrobacter sp. ISL-72]MBT2597089.1 aspartate aminotransferase family protein [Arthrobacter sp. ISL-72]